MARRNLSTRKREDLQCNNHAIQQMITPLVHSHVDIFSKNFSSIRRQHYAIRRLSWIDRPFKGSWILIRSANQLIMATHNIQMRRFVSRVATLAIWHGGAIRRAAGSWFYFYLMRRTFRHGATAVSHANNTSIFRTINEALLNVDNALCHLDHLPNLHEIWLCHCNDIALFEY